MVDTSNVAEANQVAVERVLSSDPWLVGVRPAGEVVPGLAANEILHAAPPTTWAGMCELMRAGVTGAALFEGLAGSPDDAATKLASA